MTMPGPAADHGRAPDPAPAPGGDLAVLVVVVGFTIAVLALCGLVALAMLPVPL